MSSIVNTKAEPYCTCSRFHGLHKITKTLKYNLERSIQEGFHSEILVVFYQLWFQCLHFHTLEKKTSGLFLFYSFFPHKTFMKALFYGIQSF